MASSFSGRGETRRRRAYAVAVPCQARRPWQDDAAINRVIGTAAAAAVRALTDSKP